MRRSCELRERSVDIFVYRHFLASVLRIHPLSASLTSRLSLTLCRAHPKDCRHKRHKRRRRRHVLQIERAVIVGAKAHRLRPVRHEEAILRQLGRCYGATSCLSKVLREDDRELPTELTIEGRLRKKDEAREGARGSVKRRRLKCRMDTSRIRLPSSNFHSSGAVS